MIKLIKKNDNINTKNINKNNNKIFKEVLNKDIKKLIKKISDDNIHYFSEDLNTLKLPIKNKDINYYNEIYNYLISKEKALDKNKNQINWDKVIYPTNTKKLCLNTKQNKKNVQILELVLINIFYLKIDYLKKIKITKKIRLNISSHMSLKKKALIS